MKKNSSKKNHVEEENTLEEDKVLDEILKKSTPFFFKYLDFDQLNNFYFLIAYRFLYAAFLTANMAHPDEYWQVT